MPRDGIYQVGLVGTGGIARAHGGACQHPVLNWLLSVMFLKVQ